MDSKKFIELCKSEIRTHYANTITDEEIYVVWSCKTLQNNKALLSTTVTDGKYFEITFNGDTNEMYFDVYKKQLNKCFDLSPNKEYY